MTSAYYFRILLHTIKEPTTAVWSIFAHRSLKPIGVHNGRDSQTVEQIAEEKMSKGHILIFEKHAGTSNSFYTMIVQDGQQFLANYGICDGAGFVRSILKPQAQWDSTIQDRLNHGYMRVYTGTIDYDKYVVMLRKIAQLSQKAGTDTTVAWLHYILLKTGKLSGGEMVEANSINMGMGSC